MSPIGEVSSLRLPAPGTSLPGAGPAPALGAPRKSGSSLAERLAPILAAFERFDGVLGRLRDTRVETLRSITRKGDPEDLPVPGVVRSAIALGLDLAARPSFLVSTEALNTSTVAPPNPVWTRRGSTSEVTLGGAYDGSEGAQHQPHFRVRSDTLTVDDSVQRVTLEDRATRQQFELDVSADRSVSGPYGLTFTFGRGTLVKNDDLERVTLGDVRPDASAPFDAEPRLEPGLSVRAGSFDLNSATIAVRADDSIREVEARINAAGAGVAARYRNNTETFELVSARPIVIANDTSGFLAAMKIDPRPQSELDDLPLASVSALAGSRAGTLSIDDVEIAIDPDTDSLGALLRRVNLAGARARASYDVETDLVTFSGPGRFTLSDDSGLLDALGVRAGTYGEDGEGSGRAVVRRVRRFANPKAVTDDLTELGETLRTVFGSVSAKTREGARIRTALLDAFADAFSRRNGVAGRHELSRRFGLDFSPDERPDDPLRVRRAAFARGGTEGYEDLIEFLTRKQSGSEGVLPRLERALAQAREELLAEADSKGSGALIDTFG